MMEMMSSSLARRMGALLAAAAARPGAPDTASLSGSSRGGTSPPAASATATLDDLDKDRPQHRAVQYSSVLGAELAAARPGAHATTSLKGSSRGGTSPPAASATATLDDLGQGTGCSTGRTVQRHHSTWQCRLPHRQPPARQCLEGVRPQHTRN